MGKLEKVEVKLEIVFLMKLFEFGNCLFFKIESKKNIQKTTEVFSADKIRVFYVKSGIKTKIIFFNFLQNYKTLISANNQW